MRRHEFLLLASILLVPVQAFALGLGDIDVNSALNQELSAEIELVAAGDDIDTLEVRLASTDTFNRYGLDRPLILTQLQFDIVDNGGAGAIRVTTRDPVREPFITFLLEASWAGGRLVREYTILLDPPVFSSSSGGLDDSGFVEAPSSAFDSGFMSRSTEEVTEEPEDVYVEDDGFTYDDDAFVDVEDFATADDDYVADEIQPSDTGVSQPSVQPSQYSGDTYGPIQRNETLWSIATRLRPDSSITINQMMIAIFRANPEAFEGNINRLKAGYVLRVPDETEILAVGRGDAFSEAKQQHQDWEDWKSGLASYAPTSDLDDFDEPEAEPSLSLVAPSDDQVTDSFGTVEDDGFDSGQDFGDTSLDSGADTGDEFFVDDFGADDADGLADDNLIDVEDSALADFEDDVEAGTFDDGLGTEDDLSGAPPLDAVPDAGDDVFVADTFDDAATEETADVAEEAPTPVVARPEPKPGIVDMLMDNIIYVGAGVLGLLLVIGGVFFMRKRSKAPSAPASDLLSESWVDESGGDEEVTVVAGASESEVTQMLSPTGETLATDQTADDIMGGETMVEEGSDQSQDMGATSVDASGGAAMAAGTDEDTMIGKTVTLDQNDPLSEADFNMAYGLYDEAAAIVSKAVEAEPDRKDYKVKLAEIHFAAGNNDAFVEVAQQLHDLVGGAADADWDNVAIMGKQIAADNPLFSGAAPAAGGAVDLDFAAEDSGAASAAAETGVDMDFATELTEDEPSAEAEPAAEEPAESIDFDMSFAGGEETAAEEPTAEEPTAEEPAAEEPAADDGAIEFELGDFGTPEEEPVVEAEPAAEEPAADDGALDIDIPSADADSDDDVEYEKTLMVKKKGDSAGTESQTDFDKALNELSEFVDTNVPEGEKGEDSGDLNLDEYSFDAEAEGVADEPGSDEGGDQEEMSTKLDLARAYIDMGDTDGAKSILEEVVADGNDEQKQQAQELIDQMG